MKGTILLFCTAVCLLLLLMPGASADCNPPVIYEPVTTYWPPGPNGAITVESSPTGAVIYVNGENRGHAPVTVKDLWPGSYKITAAMSGYEDYTTTTTISGPTRSSVYCSLVPLNAGNLVYITSAPSDAQVFLDGDYRGKTPVTLARPASGTHTLRLTLDGYNDWKTTLDSGMEGTQTIAATLVPGTSSEDKGLNITSDPAGATVLLDGLERGKTPLALSNLAAGIHILEIGYAGYIPWKSTVDIPERGIKTVSVTLDSKTTLPPGWITIFSSPSDARVLLDGNYVGRTPANRSLNLDAVPAGVHTIVLEHAGYQSHSVNTTVAPNQVATINIVLVPDQVLQNGALSVSSDPAGAMVSVDNISLGISPLTASDLAPGTHQVLFTREGYQDYSTSILVSPGTTSTISISLQPAKPLLKTPLFPLTIVAALLITGAFFLRKRS